MGRGDKCCLWRLIAKYCYKLDDTHFPKWWMLISKYTEAERISPLFGPDPVYRQGLQQHFYLLFLQSELKLLAD